MKVILPYKDKPLLILGDFNLNLFEYDNNTLIDDFVNNMMSNSLFPLVNKATNFFRGSSTLIDHAWTNILNNSTKCYVVDILTSSHKPLLSSGNRNLMSNYRPISILPTLSKIFEKLIHVRIYQFLDENKVLYSYQFGFRKAHSTVHAVQTAIHSVTKALDASYQCMGIFIDFSKAFDTIQHNIQ